MKFPLHLLLASSSLSPASAYHSTPPAPSLLHSRRHRSPRATRVHYKEPSPKGNPETETDGSPSDSHANVWSVLANTERWIANTLDRSNRAARAADERREAEKKRRGGSEKKLHFADEKGPGTQSSAQRLPRSDNPYARKEVSYVCETGSELAAVVGGVFRRVREARELGEGHGRSVEARAGVEKARPTTMRQTNVVVIPNCEEISKFHIFDGLVMAINQARRASRDFVLKKEDGERKGDGKDWIVSINCAHLHPQFGTLSPEEQLKSFKHEDEEGEVDVNLRDHKRRRDEARRSPYPSVIVEVQSMPPPDFGAGRRRDEVAMDAAVEMAAKKSRSGDADADGDVTSEDVQRLEALFGLGAATKSDSCDDPFYEALGEAFGSNQIDPQTPLNLAEEWILRNDPAFDETTSTFTTSDTRQVDAAYEYVFNNIAMLDAADALLPPRQRGRKSYIVLPEFLPTSATSFDRFAGQVSNIVRAMPGLARRVGLSTFHPEHVTEGTRAPVPIVVITWK